MEDNRIDPLKHFIVESLNEPGKSDYWIAIHVQNALKILLEIEIEIEMVYGEKLTPKPIADQLQDMLSHTHGIFPNAEEIAGEMGLSRPYLSKLIREETGMSLKPFVLFHKNQNEK